jgi:hypothetical protein
VNLDGMAASFDQKKIFQRSCSSGCSVDAFGRRISGILPVKLAQGI